MWERRLSLHTLIAWSTTKVCLVEPTESRASMHKFIKLNEMRSETGMGWVLHRILFWVSSLYLSAVQCVADLFFRPF